MLTPSMRFLGLFLRMRIMARPAYRVVGVHVWPEADEDILHLVTGRAVLEPWHQRPPNRVQG